MPFFYGLNTKIRSTMLCLSGFKLYSRRVPLSFVCWQADLCEFGGNFGGGSAIQRVHEWRPPKFAPQFTQVA